MNEQEQFVAISAGELFGVEVADFVKRDPKKEYIRVAESMDQFADAVEKRGLKLVASVFTDGQFGFIHRMVTDEAYVMFHSFDNENLGVWVAEEQLNSYETMMGLNQNMEGAVG